MAPARVSSSVSPNASSATLPPFQTLLDNHATDLHRFLVATVGRGDADDCYQETWLAALRAYPRLSDSSNLKSWLLTIAHRKSIDLHRRRARQATPMAEPPEPRPDVDADPSRQAKLNGLHPIFTHVRSLPPKQRNAVALRFIADASYAEIARVMSTSEEAARRNVHEALNRLRRDYTP